MTQNVSLTDEGARRPMHGGESRVVALGGADATVGLTYPFPLSVQTELLAVSFAVVTVAGGAARQVFLYLRDGSGATVFAITAPDLQPGGAFVAYSFAPNVSAFGTSALKMQGGPFLGGKLPGNLELAIPVGFASAGDVIEDVRLLVRQWPAGQDVLGGSAAG